jgi:transcriptional regulator of acetoin/glycerol metabolism
MSEERGKVRCQRCELVQWSDRENCRRCGTTLPQPVVKIVERVVEKVVIRHDPEFIQSLAQARELISAATDRLMQQGLEAVAPVVVAQVPGQVSETGAIPTMAEMERAMILAAYRKSYRRPLEAARMLGIGKTTLYRKLKEMREMLAAAA